ncbi:MAG: helix-turn-helix transcriptional regulator [Acidobacteriota bacterium]
MPRKKASSDPAAKALAAELRSARSHFGESLREFAERIGIAFATISAVEKGRDPRASTLMAYLDAVPGLRADELLPPSDERVVHPPATHSLWAFHAASFGFRARRVRYELSFLADGTCRSELTVEGLRFNADAAHQEDGAYDLMHVAFLGTKTQARQLKLPKTGRTVKLKDGSIEHRFTIGKCLVEDGITYQRREKSAELPALHPRLQNCAHQELTLAVRYPIEELELVIKPSTRSRVTEAFAHAWPLALQPRSADESCFEELHPWNGGPAHRPNSREVALTVGKPLICCAYRLFFRRSGEGKGRPLLRPGPATADMAKAIKAARSREGLSVRELARRMKVSSATVFEMEHGRDPRASTLRRLLEATPSTAPQQLLPSPGRTQPCSFDQVWELMLALYRFVIGECHREIVIEADGSADWKETFANMRSLGEPADDLRLLMGLPNSLISMRTGIDSIDTENEDDVEAMKMKEVGRRDGNTIHQLTIPGALSRRGLTQETRRTLPPGSFSLRGKSKASGSSHPVLRPLERLHVTIRFPSGMMPTSIFATAIPSTQPPGTELVPIIERHHRGRHRFKLGKRDATLVVERPLIGFTYGIGWVLD